MNRRTIKFIYQFLKYTLIQNKNKTYRKKEGRNEKKYESSLMKVVELESFASDGNDHRIVERDNSIFEPNDYIKGRRFKSTPPLNEFNMELYI